MDRNESCVIENLGPVGIFPMFHSTRKYCHMAAKTSSWARLEARAIGLPPPPSSSAVIATLSSIYRSPAAGRESWGNEGRREGRLDDTWIHKDSGWDHEIRIRSESNSVFFDGVLHLITLEDVVAAVDMEGNTWRTIPMPQSLAEPFDGIAEGFIGLSQGYLYFVNTDHDKPYKVSVWVLEDYNSEQWIWKHTVSHLHLFRTKRLLFGHDYKVVSIHPERNIIFLVLSHSKMLMSYELDSREVHFICGIGGSSEWLLYYLPYVPLYSESLADGH
uniref:F-box associated domain-containing protein n=1 Tax=Oryza punctata TaxID=4537 RepID=A0A0E0KZ49_ORYPU